MPKKLQTQKNKAVENILGGKVGNFPEHPDYTKAKSIQLAGEETIHVKNPISGRSADVVLSRNGTTDEKLAMVMLSPDATREQKDSMLAQMLFERGKESSSFLAELFLSKGKLFKDNNAFKKQVRFDFERFADIMVQLLTDISRNIELNVTSGEKYTLVRLADDLKSGAELIARQRKDITEARMRDAGFGIYIDKQGKTYSTNDADIEDAIKRDREEQ